jgi:hypothetical protein
VSGWRRRIVVQVSTPGKEHRPEPHCSPRTPTLSLREQEAGVHFSGLTSIGVNLSVSCTDWDQELLILQKRLVTNCWLPSSCAYNAEAKNHLHSYYCYKACFQQALVCTIPGADRCSALEGTYPVREGMMGGNQLCVSCRGRVYFSNGIQKGGQQPRSPRLVGVRGRVRGLTPGSGSATLQGMHPPLGFLYQAGLPTRLLADLQFVATSK